MAEKKHMHRYETDVMALPPLRMMLGEVPIPDPDGRRKSNLKRQEMAPELEGSIKRLIAHLKDEKK